MTGRPSTLRALLDLRAPRRRVRYGSHRQQRAELHLPAGDGPHPVAVVIQGGFWRARRTLRYVRPLCALLARNGWAAWNVDYRRVGRGEGGGWPATFADVGAGIDALSSAGDGSLDLGRVVSVGHSAGGHLALWAACRPGLPADAPGADPAVRVGAVAAIAAVSNLEAVPSLYQPGGAVLDLMGTPPDAAPDDRYAIANPARRLPLGIPILLLHGVVDETVPISRSRDFAAMARAAGDGVTLVEPPDAGHRTVVDPRRDEVGHLLEWLRER
jgi:acetyl esterase/lipase